MNNTPFTKDEIDTIIRLWNLGYSAKKITTFLPGRTRNAICGFVHRWRKKFDLRDRTAKGVASPPAPVDLKALPPVPPRTRKPRAKAADKPAGEKRARKPPAAPMPDVVNVQTIVATLPEPEPEPELERLPDEPAWSMLLWETGSTRCKFPMWAHRTTPAAAGAFACGAPVPEDTPPNMPYCAKHREICKGSRPPPGPKKATPGARKPGKSDVAFGHRG